MKIRFWVCTRYVGSKIEETIDIDDDEIGFEDDMTDEEKQKAIEDYCEEYLEDWLSMNCESGWHVNE